MLPKNLGEATAKPVYPCFSRYREESKIPLWPVEMGVLAIRTELRQLELLESLAGELPEDVLRCERRAGAGRSE
jgi:hypothetical protein